MPAPSQSQDDRNEAIILGQEEAYKVYLSEKVRRGEMTPAEADRRQKAYSALGMTKEWLSPAKDAREVHLTLSEIAEEMGSWWSQVYFKRYGNCSSASSPLRWSSAR
jgi:hypothetical protein